LVNLI